MKSAARFDLRTLLAGISAVAIPLGLTRAYGLGSGLLLSIAAAAILAVAVRKWFAGIVLLAYVGAFLLVYGIAVVDVANTGPYVTYYNQRLYDEAMRASLVGSPEELVESTLGPATFKYQYPNVGWPYDEENPDYVPPLSDFEPHEITTTYNYAPYSYFPFAKFQVHCCEGKVESLEMFDD